MGFSVIMPKKATAQLDDVVARIKDAARNPALTVGVHREEAKKREEPGGPTNADLALWHEFGTEDVPARPFIRPVMASNRAVYAKLLTQYYKSGKTPMECLKLLGMVIVSDMRKGLLRGVKPDLSEARIEAKREAGYPRPHTPLFATGALFNSIAAKVEEKK